MKRTFALILLLALIILITGCEPSENAKNISNPQPADNNLAAFIPPADGLITETQADKYIQVAKDFNDAIMEQVKIMDEFYTKYSITGKEEISKLEGNEKAMQEWEGIKNLWTEREQQIYVNNKMTSQEFDWIAQALIDQKNAGIQKKIEKALTSQ